HGDSVKAFILRALTRNRVKLNGLCPEAFALNALCGRQNVHVIIALVGSLLCVRRMKGNVTSDVEFLGDVAGEVEAKRLALFGVEFMRQRDFKLTRNDRIGPPVRLLGGVPKLLA